MPKSPDAHLITVLWALPAAPERAKLRALVVEFARQCDAPIFEPHLTLGLGGPEALDCVHQQPFRLRVAGFDFTEKFTKTLFLRLSISPDLIALRTALGRPATDDYDPHLSLLYREMPIARKADLARQAPLPLDTVLFDRLAAVSCSDATSSPADVESWKILATHPLNAPPASEPGRSSLKSGMNGPVLTMRGEKVI